MANSKLTEALEGLFPTTDPKAATKTPSGATVTKGRQPAAQDGEANYLPLIALGAAAALVVWAMLRPGPLLGSGLREAAWQPPSQPSQNYQEQNSEDGWPAYAQEE